MAGTPRWKIEGKGPIRSVRLADGTTGRLDREHGEWVATVDGRVGKDQNMHSAIWKAIFGSSR